VDFSLYLKAVVMGVVEGVTEFLPISSTGHLILAGGLLGFGGEKAKLFEIVIQTGAMLAVVWEYRVKFLGVLTGIFRDRGSQRFVMNVAVAFIPAAVVGVIFGDYIKERLFAPIPVALAFIIGGLVIIWAERRRHRITIERVDDMTWPVALQIGLAQCFALIPGTSRSAATIIGGLLFGLSRQAATEFSFFLAVPTLIAAGAYEMYQERGLLSPADAGWFGVGGVVAFVSALLCLRWLIRYVASHDFTGFAVYRIVFGVIVIATAYAGLVTWSAR
jgi:undecaprenyl-diphosphatase